MATTALLLSPNRMRGGELDDDDCGEDNNGEDEMSAVLTTGNADFHLRPLHSDQEFELGEDDDEEEPYDDRLDELDLPSPYESRHHRNCRDELESEAVPAGWLAAVPHVGLAMAVLSSLFFSLCSLIVRQLNAVSPLEHSTMRFVGVLLPAVCIVCYSRQHPLGPAGSRAVLLLRGVLGSAGLMFQFYSFQHLPLADASVLIFSSPVFVTIFARIFLGERVGPAQIATIVATLVGVVLISRPPFLFGGDGSGGGQSYSAENLIGALSAMAGTVCSANVYILLRKLRHLHYAVIMMTFATIGIALSHSVSLALGTGCLPCSFRDRLSLLLLGVFSFCGQVLLTKALQYEQAGPVSICRTADIVFAFIWQVSFLGDVPSWPSLLGAALVTCSVLLMGCRKWLLELPPTSAARRRLWILIA